MQFPGFNEITTIMATNIHYQSERSCFNYPLVSMLISCNTLTKSSQSIIRHRTKEPLQAAKRHGLYQIVTNQTVLSTFYSDNKKSKNEIICQKSQIFCFVTLSLIICYGQFEDLDF